MRVFRVLAVVFVLLGALFICLGMPVIAAEKQSTALQDEAEEEQLFEKFFGSGPQEEDYWRADKLLLTATGSQIPVFKAPSVASMITKEEIEAMGATTLNEILETVPGLHVFPSGFNLFTSVWSIRGIQSGINPEVLLLINGIPLTPTYDGGRPKGFTMPVAMISRVEVVRGPGSAVHGADAFSGVINVITKDNFEIDGTRMGARYGSFDTYDVWLQHGGQYKGWDLWGGIEIQKSEGDRDQIIDSDYMDALGLSAFSNTPGYLDTSYTVTNAHLGLRKDNFTLQLFGAMLESGMGPGALQAITYGNEIDNTEFIVDFLWRDKNFTEDWDLSLRLYHTYLKTDTFFEILPSSFRNMLGNPMLTDNNSGLEVTAFYGGFNQHRLRLSAGMKSFDTNTAHLKNFGAGVAVPFGPLVDVSNTPFVFMEDQERELFFTSLQDEWDITNRLTFTGGIRLDEYSDFGTTINPRAALVWEPFYFLTTKLLYGRAFRAPSFGQQYVQNNVVVRGNPDLGPETIDTYELVFDLQPMKDLHTVVSFYTFRAEDVSEFIEDGLGGLPSPQNIGVQEGRGFEIEAEWDVCKTLKLKTNLAYQHTENKKTDSPVPDTPELQFYFNPHWVIAENWSLDGQYFWIGKQHRAVGDPREDIDDYDLVNLTLRRKNIANHFDLAFSVRNLFDENGKTPSPYDPDAPGGAYIPDDYPIAGRSFWVEVSYKF